MADIDFGNAVTVPGEGIGGYWDKFSNLTKDRNFMSLLAGVGSRLGRGGVGEAIGVPTQQMIQSQATQEALAAGEAKRGKWNSDFLKILAGMKYTPADLEGPTKLTMDHKGMNLQITPPGGVPSVENPASAPQSEAATTNMIAPMINTGAAKTSKPAFVGANGGIEYAQPPEGGGVPMSTPKLNLTDVLGFWPTQSR